MRICWHPVFTSFLLKLIYYLLAPSKSHKNPSLFCFTFCVPLYMYSTAKFWPKGQLQLTFCRSHFMIFAQITKSSSSSSSFFFFFCRSQCPTLLSATILLAKNWSPYFTSILAFIYGTLAKIFQQKTR